MSVRGEFTVYKTINLSDRTEWKKNKNRVQVSHKNYENYCHITQWRTERLQRKHKTNENEVRIVVPTGRRSVGKRCCKKVKAISIIKSIRLFPE